MPLYDIKCSQSGNTFERHIKLEKFAEPIICACGATANRLISKPLFSVDSTGYNCPVSGRWIGSKREHQENLRQQGCRVLEDGETEAAARVRKEADEAFDRKIEDAVEKQVEGYSSDKREKLHNELVNGKLDVQIERR